MPLQDLWEATAEQGPAWTVRVTLIAMRARDWDFDQAWHSALQRLRAQPNMTPDDIEELIEVKAWLQWARPVWQAAYEGTEAPPLIDGEVFTAAERVNLAPTVRRSGNPAPPQS